MVNDRFFLTFCTHTGRPGIGILRAANIGDRKLPWPTGHGRVLWQRFLVVRPTAVVFSTAQHTAMYRRTAMQHTISGVLARIPEPTTATAVGWVVLVLVSRQQSGDRWRRFFGHGFQSPPNPQLSPAPLLIWQRHQSRPRRKFVYVGQWRRSGIIGYQFARGLQQPRCSRWQPGITVYVQLDG